MLAFALLIVISAGLAWINERFIRIPTTVGVTVSGALASLAVTLFDFLGPGFGLREWATGLLNELQFTEVVLNGALSVLLFAGALELDAPRMWRQRVSVITLALLTTAISTLVIGGGAWLVFAAFGIDVPIIWALVFGALISPTDPVAVLDLVKRAHIPKRVETLISGESLFNDGIGVVLFLALLSVAVGDVGGASAGLSDVVGLFIREAAGGVLLGIVVGYPGYRLCRSISGAEVEVLITFAMVVGGYFTAAHIGVSGPLAMVVAGLIMSAKKSEAFVDAGGHVERFWEILEQVLNIMLFAYIGMNVILTQTRVSEMLAAVILIVVALLGRWVSVGLPMTWLRRRDHYGRYTVRLLTWGGLRGGIAISLALALPPGPHRMPLLTATYVIVLFTITVQGLTIMPLVRRVEAAAQRPGSRH